jgi:ABC-type glutathione transport system ATPase component
MSPWQPSLSHCRNRSPGWRELSQALRGNRQNPSALAFSFSALTKFVLCLFTRSPYSGIGLLGRFTNMHAIEARGLVKQFDGFRAVDGIDLNVPEGSIYGILGPNGAGKTTTIRMLSGDYRSR